MDYILGYGNDRTYARLVGRNVVDAHLTQLHTVSGVLYFKPYLEYRQSKNWRIRTACQKS